MKNFLAIIALLASFTSPGQASEVRLAIEEGNTARCFNAIREIYASFGVEFNDALTLVEQPSLEMLSYYSPDSETITLSKFLGKGGGRAYWQNWSHLMSNDTWNIDQVFRNEREMDLLGNYAIMGILAHEFGHYVAEHYGMNSDFCHDELKADELAIHVLNELARGDKQLKKWRQRYYEVVTISLHDSSPEGIRIEFGDHPVESLQDLENFCTDFDMPDGPAYVSFQILRQRKLLEFKDLYEHAALKEILQTYDRKRKENIRKSDLSVKITELTEIQKNITETDIVNRMIGVSKSGAIYRRSYETADNGAIMVRANSIKTGYPFFEDTLSRITGTNIYGPRDIIACEFVDVNHVYLLMQKKKAGSAPGIQQDIPVTLIRCVREREGYDIQKIAFPKELLLLKGAIAGVSKDEVLVSIIELNHTDRIFEWELWSIRPEEEKMVEIQHLPIDKTKFGVTDGSWDTMFDRFQTAPFIKQSTHGLLFPSHDMLKIASNGSISTLAGNRAGWQTEQFGNTFWNPLILGEDRNGFVYVLSMQSEVSEGAFKISHRLLQLEILEK